MKTFFQTFGNFICENETLHSSQRTNKVTLDTLFQSKKKSVENQPPLQKNAKKVQFCREKFWDFCERCIMF